MDCHRLFETLSVQFAEEAKKHSWLLRSVRGQKISTIEQDLIRYNDQPFLNDSVFGLKIDQSKIAITLTTQIPFQWGQDFFFPEYWLSAFYPYSKIAEIFKFLMEARNNPQNMILWWNDSRNKVVKQGFIIDTVPERFSFENEREEQSLLRMEIPVEWGSPVNYNYFTALKDAIPFDPMMSLVLSQRSQPISIIQDERERFLKRNFNDLFYLNGRYHYSFTIDEKEISLIGTSSILGDIVGICHAVEKELKLDLDLDNVQLSMNINSPGCFDVIMSTIPQAIAIMVVISAVTARKLEINSKHFSFKMENDASAFEQFIDAIIKIVKQFKNSHK